MLADIVDMLVDLIGEHEEVVVAQDDICQRFQFCLVVDASRRVARGTEYQHTGLGGDGGLQLFRSHLEVLLETSLHDDGLTTSQLYHLGITNPVRSGDDDFLTVVDQCHNGIADALLGAIGYQNFVDGVVKSVFVLQLSHDGLAKIRIARYGGVSRIVVVYGLLGCFFNVVRRVEVRLSHAHVDHIYSLRFHFCAFLRHSQRG